MTPQSIAAVLLALAVLAAWLRLWLGHRRDARRPRAWRLAVLVLLQPLLALALHATLFPPASVLAPGELTLLTEGASAGDVPEAARDGLVLALPEARAGGDVARVPDLGTALRQHPGTTRVHVVGAGLVARDRDAAAHVDIAFVPAAAPRGFVRIEGPGAVGEGSAFRISGRIAGVDGASVELLDPAARRIDRASPEASGAFVLDAVAFAPGAADYTVRLRDEQGAIVDEAGVPLWIDAATVPRVLLLAGAPNAETRALRRWLEDAGVPVQARIALGGGVQLGDAATTPQALAQADLLVADARAWGALGQAGRAQVLAAVRNGLGLLVRADTPMPAASLQALRAPGFSIRGGEGTQAWSPPAPGLRDEAALRARIGAGSRDAPFDLAQAEDALPPLARRAWRIEGPDAAPLSATGGLEVGAWRAAGRGRIGVWTLLDSYQWPLHGRGDQYGALWSDAVATLARARAADLATFTGIARVDERLTICGVREGATVDAPDGTSSALRVEGEAGARGCAGAWPTQAGWHRLRSGDAVQAFHVQATDAAHAGLHRAELREATLQLAASPPRVAAATDVTTPRRAPGSPWPGFAAWLLLATLAWWLERARVGFAAGTGEADAASPMR